MQQKSDKDGDTYSLQWDISDDGSVQVNPPYAKVMALGSAAFALSLIQEEENDEEPKPTGRTWRTSRTITSSRPRRATSETCSPLENAAY